MENHKTCSFFGHRKIDIDDALKQKVIDCIEDLIVNHNVQTFLFGSNSNFIEFCHLAVTQLKEKRPEIKRIFYTCKSESCVLESQREEKEKSYSLFLKRKVRLLGFEQEIEHKTKYTAGKASYIERNQAIINDSDFCVFYYDKNYRPTLKNPSLFPHTSTKSGTKLAYNYAIKKHKTIINLK